MIKRGGLVLLLALFTFLGTMMAPAQANHNGVSVTFSGSVCEGLTFVTGWDGEDHKVDNTVLVLKVDGEIQTAAIGESLTVGPFEEPTKVYYRVWGGGERGYDDPVLDNLAALVEYLGTGGSPLDVDAPGVTWYKEYVKACAPEPTPTPTPTPTLTPTEGPTPTPTLTLEPTEDPVCDLVEQLDVAEEQRDGYDRSLFGDYDRDALLQASKTEHGDYYSTWDDTHYEVASAVQVDHLVALAEAWDSGAHSWSADKLEEFGGDASNLTLLTSSLNSSKQDDDIAEWLPPVDSLVDEYLLAWIAVKAEYDLSVDPAERDRLTELAVEYNLCDGQQDEEPAPAGNAGGLPMTGTSLPVLIGAGLVLVGAGTVIVLLLRKPKRDLGASPVE